ncbi:MAG TPA: transglycosylase SLT domain-containing protein [Candidatus Hydrogenedentes bacterium]|nr:transglycosylase SLT domain-containing protein [Candidatus Hydrogenedentota bacterium]
MVSLFSTGYGCVLVLSLVAGALPGEEAYLEARDFERGARYADALSAFDGCAGAGGPLTPYALIGAARCRAHGGSRADAIAGYQRVLEAHPSGPWTGMALAGLAEALRLEKRFPEAAGAYLKILDRPAPSSWRDRYRWQAVLCLAEDPAALDKALPLCRTLCAEAGSSRIRLDAAQVLAKSADPVDRFAAAYAMVKSGAYADASGLLPKEEEAGAAEPGWAYLRARVFIGLREAEQGRALLQRIAAAHPQTEWARLSLMHHARSLLAGGQHEKAGPLLETLLTGYPGSEEAAETVWRFAELSSGREETAARYYLRFASLFPDDARADDALLLAGRLYSDTGRNTEAIAAFGRLIESYPGSRFLADAAYQRGDLRARGRDKEGAAADFELATRGDLGNYYVHRALQRLHELGHTNPVKPGPALPVCGKDSFVRPFACEETPAPAPMAEGDELARVRFFGAHGFEEGEWEAVALAAGGPELPQTVYETVAAAGLPTLALWLIGVCAPEAERDVYHPRWWRVQFPRAYWDDVQSIAGETGLDPYLILSVCRQESFFRAGVVSPAGATGVMQLMPGTAQWLASVEPSVGREHVDHLTHPANSLRLGAYYLMRMIARSDGNLIYALASYNAGPGNVSKWRKQLGGAPPEAFLEAIPFTETRHFVKRVLGNYGAYYSLYPRKTRPNNAEDS